MRSFRWGLGLCVLVSVIGSPVDVLADLILFTNPSPFTTSGANPLVTVHHARDGSESGCITMNGSFFPCLNNGNTRVIGGGNIGSNNVLTFTTDQSFAAILASKDANHSFAGTLTDLYLTFTGQNGTHTAEYRGPDILAAGPLVFVLDDAAAAAVQALGSSVMVTGGVSFLTGSLTAGPESLFVLPFSRVTQGAVDAGGLPAVSTPEPGTLVLLGSGLLAAALAALRSKRALMLRRH